MIGSMISPMAGLAPNSCVAMGTSEARVFLEPQNTLVISSSVLKPSRRATQGGQGQHDQQQHAGPRGRARQGAHAVVAPQAAGVLLDELAVLRRGGSRLPLPKDRRLMAICNALQESPADARSLSDWAGKVGASERTLARLFVRETGLGFGVWRQRLVLSLDALQAGAAVTEVAMAHGYESPSAFIAAFRGVFGVTPGGCVGVRKDADDHRPAQPELWV